MLSLFHHFYVLLQLFLKYSYLIIFISKSLFDFLILLFECWILIFCFFPVFPHAFYFRLSLLDLIFKFSFNPRISFPCCKVLKFYLVFSHCNFCQAWSELFVCLLQWLVVWICLTQFCLDLSNFVLKCCDLLWQRIDCLLELLIIVLKWLILVSDHPFDNHISFLDIGVVFRFLHFYFTI